MILYVYKLYNVLYILVAPMSTSGLFLATPNKMLTYMYVKISDKIGNSHRLVQGRNSFYKHKPYHVANTLHLVIFPCLNSLAIIPFLLCMYISVTTPYMVSHHKSAIYKNILPYIAIY